MKFLLFLLFCFRFQNVLPFGTSHRQKEVVPFIVSITDQRVHICVGTVLSMRTILSTALCVDNPKPLRVIAYSTRCHLEELTDATAFDIIKRFQHPKFNRHSLHADVAVLYVDRNLDSAGAVVPAPLPDRSLTPGDRVRVFGWNLDFIVLRGDKRLYSVNTQVIDPQICVQHYGQRFLVGEMLCMDMYREVDTPIGKAKGCEMDPSSPAIVADGQSVGALASFAGGCLYQGWPGVYVDIFPFKQWIVEKLFQENDDEYLSKFYDV